MSKQNGKAILEEPQADHQEKPGKADKPETNPELMKLIEEVKAVAKASKLSLENVLQAYEILELKRCNDICSQQGKGSDEQMDRVTRHLDEIARNAKDAADSLYYISEARR